MSRIASSSRDVALSGLRRRWLPIVSVLIAGLLHLLPVVVQGAYLPDFAFLVLVSWRLLRPEMWTASMALPLGLYNDLVAGHPLGESMALWTILFLLFDLLDTRVSWRDYWMDWLFASLAILFYTSADWLVARAMGSSAHISTMGPQMLVSVFAFPLVARFVLVLDRWRLSR